MTQWILCHSKCHLKGKRLFAKCYSERKNSMQELVAKDAIMSHYEHVLVAFAAVLQRSAVN